VTSGTPEDEPRSEPAERPIRVLLVDDHDFFRTGLRQLLSQQTGLEVVGEAPDGAAAIELYKRRKPDVIVMDLQMPVLSGIEATRHITRSSPEVKILALTVSDDYETVIEAIRAGASGYLVKDAALGEIDRAINAVASGQLLVSPSVARTLSQTAEDAGERLQKMAMIQASLSEPERDTLRLIAEGKGNGEIARELYLSPSTVKNRVADLLQKLNLDNRVEAAVYAVRSGLA
jgi:DNA-binding NarL/FixJ family response regulator